MSTDGSAAPTPPAGLLLPEALWDAVRTAYATPGRSYHALPHVLEVVRAFHQVDRELGWQRPREVFLAVLFHDAVYVAGAEDNEALSAALATREIARCLPRAGLDTSLVGRLIELTRRHGSISPSDVNVEEALFLDCDMAILGSDPATFDRYDRGVAEEWSALPPEIYEEGRRAFLEKLLSKERIFLSDHFHARLDAQARVNLRARLSKATS